MKEKQLKASLILINNHNNNWAVTLHNQICKVKFHLRATNPPLGHAHSLTKHSVNEKIGLINNEYEKQNHCSAFFKSLRLSLRL